MLVGNVRTLLLLWFCMSHRAWGDPWEWRVRKNYLPVCHAWEKHGKPQAVPMLQTTWGRWDAPLLKASSVKVPVPACLGFSSSPWPTLCSPQLLECPFYLEAERHLLLHSCFFLSLFFLFISQILERTVEWAGGFPISSLLFGGGSFFCKTIYAICMAL